MNSLAVATESKLRGVLETIERNRKRFPKAYAKHHAKEREIFLLGNYLVNYCMEKDEEGYFPDWVDSFMTGLSCLYPGKSRRDYYGNEFSGFFALPREVQEGILIYLQEEFFDPFHEAADLSVVSHDFWNATCEIVRRVAEEEDKISLIVDSEQKEEEIDQEVFGWEEFMGYNYPNRGIADFFFTEEEVLFVTQLAAYMGFEVTLSPDDVNDSELYISDSLIYAMKEWEKKGIVLLNGSKEFDHTDTVFVVNSVQGLLTGNKEVGKYMEEVINHMPWQYDLKELMENFEEYFPLKGEPLRVDAYAQIIGRA